LSGGASGRRPKERNASSLLNDEPRQPGEAVRQLWDQLALGTEHQDITKVEARAGTGISPTLTDHDSPVQHALVPSVA